MTRLIDRLRMFGFCLPGRPDHKIKLDNYAGMFDYPVIVADNVAAYYFEENPQEYWDVGVDFPAVAPPFGTFFMEAKSPQYILSGTQRKPWGRAITWGLFCEAIDPTELNSESARARMSEQIKKMNADPRSTAMAQANLANLEQQMIERVRTAGGVEQAVQRMSENEKQTLLASVKMIESASKGDPAILLGELDKSQKTSLTPRWPGQATQ